MAEGRDSAFLAYGSSLLPRCSLKTCKHDFWLRGYVRRTKYGSHPARELKMTCQNGKSFSMAEGAGFEPAMELPPYRLSKAAH